VQQGVSTEHDPGRAARKGTSKSEGALYEPIVFHLAKRSDPQDAAGPPKHIAKFDASFRSYVPNGAVNDFALFGGRCASIFAFPDKVRGEMDRMLDRIANAIGMSTVFEELSGLS
jgi:hypothetical protein